MFTWTQNNSLLLLQLWMSANTFLAFKKQNKEAIMLIEHLRFTCSDFWLVTLLILNLTQAPPVVPITPVVSVQNILNEFEHKGLLCVIPGITWAIIDSVQSIRSIYLIWMANIDDIFDNILISISLGIVNIFPNLKKNNATRQ